MKKKKKIFTFELSGWILLLLIGGFLLFLFLSIFSVGHPPYVSEKKKAAELNTAMIHLVQAEYNSNNGVYYYTSGGCNSNTTQQIITNLFDGNSTYLSEKTKKEFYYCIGGDSNSNTFKITAKSVSTNCEIHRDEKNNVTYNNC